MADALIQNRIHAYLLYTMAKSQWESQEIELKKNIGLLLIRSKNNKYSAKKEYSIYYLLKWKVNLETNSISAYLSRAPIS